MYTSIPVSINTKKRVQPELFTQLKVRLTTNFFT
uniref:Uncharacterized protein n=1 Tax=Anguilla anguilla TaxID=7936 RepID=A0A0E9XS97_ANGAN